MFEILLATQPPPSLPIITVGYSLFGGGNTPTAATRTYTHSTDAVADGTALSVAVYGQGTASNGTVGLFAGGQGAPTVMDKFAFDTMARTSGAALNVSRIQSSGSSNTVVAIFAGGNSLSSSTRYQYSGDSVSVGSALGSVRSTAASLSTSTLAVICGGGTGTNGAATILVQRISIPLLIILVWADRTLMPIRANWLLVVMLPRVLLVVVIMARWQWPPRTNIRSMVTLEQMLRAWV